MPYYAVANLLTVTKTIMIDEMPCGYGILRTTGVRIWHHVSRRACAEVVAALEVSRKACAEVAAALEVSLRACAEVSAALEVSSRPAQSS
jgi:hypothetical protein